MVGLYAHCAFNLNSRAASIDTPLHALVDRPHIDHMHPDAVIGSEVCSDALNLLPLREAAALARESMRGVVA